MKKIIFVVIIFSSICSFANQREFRFSARRSTGEFLNTTIEIYSYDHVTKGYSAIPIASGYTTSYSLFGIWNGLGYVEGVSGQDSTSTIEPNPMDSVSTYLIRVENLYVIIHPGPQGFDANIYYTVTNDVASLTVSTAATVLAENETWSPKTISLRNDFGSDRNYVSGKVYLSWEEIITGYSYTNRYRQASAFPLYIWGEDNQYLSGNDTLYYRKWRKWEDGFPTIYRELFYAKDYYHTAIYARECNITIQNDFGTAGNGGTIKFWGTTYSSPYTPTSPVYEDENSTVEAISQATSYVDFSFHHWEFESNNIDSSNPKTDFKPTSHGTLKAKFTGKPVNGYRNLSFNTDEEGQPVRLTWSKHPLDNSSVTHYAVWRQVTKSGTPTLLTTVSATGSSSYSFIDYDYTICSSYQSFLLFYDVRAYYEPDNAYSDIDFHAVYGFSNQNQQPDEIIQNQISIELPATLSISNYPNPYNPTTTISYQLPENSFVTIKVFDILGKEIAELVNESKPAGYYTINFDGSRLTSGIYIYTITANGIVQSKKMLLAK